jgi:excinuclease ABC subunit C
MNIPSIELQIQTLPDNPGVYQYYDKEGKILYVGKAKNLKKRVSSYFNKQHDNAKTNVLVRKIVEIKHIVVCSEQDALLLENNLIKKLQPRYNVLLRDDKTYPWICIKKEPFSRIFPTRRMTKDGSEYFGPYTNFKTVNTILDLIKELYPLRTCNYDLSESNIRSKKYKVCLEYHIGNCKGPCEGFETLENYQKQVDVIRQILKGNFKDSMRDFKKMMQDLASEMKFEAAQKVKDKINVLENYQSRSTILNPKISNIDEVFSILY